MVRDHYPGLGKDLNKFSATTTSEGATINLEQHASVPRIEEMGLLAMGYNIVNVAQKLDVTVSPKGAVSVSAATDVFPSATLTVNGSTIMQYNQPSFVETHKLPIKGYTQHISGPGGSVPSRPIYDATYKPAMWYKQL